MSTTKFNLSDEEMQTYQKGVRAFLSRQKVSAEAFAGIQDMIMNQVTASLDKMNIFLLCDGKPGEVYNRKTGEVYKIERIGKTVNNQTDPIKTLGTFRKAKNKATTQPVAGAVGRF